MILLYNPPSSAQRKPVLPMSLLALGAVLEGEYEYRIIDGNLEREPLPVLDGVIRETGTDILAVTVMPGPQLNNAFPVCKQLKHLHPQMQIVWGGYFPTQHYEACLASDFVDFVVRGHGELVFLELVTRLRGKKRVDGLRGLACRNPETGETVNNEIAFVPDPNTLPEFPYHRVKMRHYVRETFMGRTLSHHSSYGCPFFCNFCAVVNLVNGRWLAQSAERTARVARYLVENWQLNAVEFFDNNFFVDQSRVVEFCERILDLGIHWWGEARIDTLLNFSPRSWDLMARSGLRMVFLGAESGSDETLKRMQKGGKASTEKALAMAQKTKQYGIVPEFSFVLGNPPEPEGDIDQTLRFIRRLKGVNPKSEIILYLYTPVPLSGDLYEQAQQSGFRWPTTLEEWVKPDWQEFSQRRSGQLPWLTRRLRNRIRNFERVLHAYYPTSTDPRLQGFWYPVLKAASAWRYHLRIYHFPLELRALQRWTGYQHPETSGF